MATNTERTVYIIELRDKFTKGMDTATRSNNRFNKSTERIKKRTDGITKSFNLMRVAAIGAAVYGIGRMLKGMADLAGKFEEVRVAFNVMLGDKGLGGTMMAWAKEFSRSTVVTFDQTVTSLRKLLAYGISGQNARPLTEMLSTIAAGVGTDRLPYLTLALGQVFSRGRLMGTELRQFREHGVDIVSEIAKGMTKRKGRTVLTAEVEKMVTAGQISFDMVAESMIDMTKEGGRFYGMLIEASRTWPGVTAIMKSTWQIFITELIEPFMVTMKAAVVNITSLIQNLKNMIPGIQAVGSAFGQMFSDMFGEVTKDSLISKLATARAIAGILVVMGGVIATVFDAIAFFFDGISEKIKQVWNILSGVTGLIKTLASPGGGVDKAWEDLQSAISDFFISDGGALDRFTTREGEMWDKIIKAINAPLEKTKLDTGVFTPVGGTGAEPLDGAAGARTRKTNRLVGTGARDIIINIGSLIENVTNNNAHYANNLEAMQEQLTKTLLTAVNDVTLLAEA